MCLAVLFFAANRSPRLLQAAGARGRRHSRKVLRDSLCCATRHASTLFIIAIRIYYLHCITSLDSQLYTTFALLTIART